MTSSWAPHKLWDNCLELEAFIRSHTALNLFELQGQIPETYQGRQQTYNHSWNVDGMSSLGGMMSRHRYHNQEKDTGGG